MYEGSVIYKLNTISILPQEINLSPEDFTIDPRFPIYKLEVWLDNILLDETYDITISEKKVNSTSKVLIFANKSFRYFTRELFNKLKVARLRVVIMRGESKWETFEQIQAFNIILSQYSYEYCKSKINQFRQHAVGTIKRGFFHYKILCQYEELISVNEKSKNTDSQYEVKILPINSLPEDNAFQQNLSDVFIQLKQLKPVYRHQSIDQEKIKIKVQGSVLNAELADSQETSVIKLKEEMKTSTSNAFLYLYYIYMIISMGLIVIQMNPTKRV